MIADSDRERRELIGRFHRIYRSLQERYSLREQSHFDLYGNNSIEIWEYENNRRKRCICKVKDEEELTCYKRAIETLESYDRKERAENEKKVG